jgi:hypothetical protein
MTRGFALLIDLQRFRNFSIWVRLANFCFFAPEFFNAKTQRREPRVARRRGSRQVLECAGPPALWERPPNSKAAEDCRTPRRKRSCTMIEKQSCGQFSMEEEIS